jgi:acyl carrier protein
MPENSILSSIERLCAMPQGSLGLDTRLARIPSWDSLRVLEFVAMLDTDFGITLESDAMGDCETVGDLAELVEDACSRKDS